MTAERPRIGIAFENLGPYHVARLEGAAAFADVVALEISPSRSVNAWNKPALPPAIGYRSLADDAGVADAASIRRALDEQQRAAPLAAVAIAGWSSQASLAMLDWAARRGVPAVLMSETNRYDFARKPIAEWIKRGIIAHFGAALTTSPSQQAYLEELGVGPERIFRGYNVVGNAYFTAAADRVRADAAMPVLAGQPLPENARGRYFLASNRFIEKKNLFRLLRGYARFRDAHGTDATWPLVILGDGELRAELEAERARLGLESSVLMPGFRQIDELPLFYGTAGGFVLASTVEQWGLVVNEAMASGLPVAVSDRCGCAEVLVEDGVTGFTFDPLDEDAIAAALRRLAAAAEEGRMGERARARVTDWGPERFGSGLLAAVEIARDSPPPRPGLLAHVRLAAMLALRTARPEQNVG